jgi:hypothetical protein
LGATLSRSSEEQDRGSVLTIALAFLAPNPVKAAVEDDDSQ